ncbi:hypothetical protein RyT2_10490 [Pseudolactococcus yaeyamensis]
MLTKLRKNIPLIIFILTTFYLIKYEFTPKNFANYTELLSELNNFSLALISIALAILGAINVFKDYSFIKRLYQLNVDLDFSKRLLKFTCMTIVFSILIIGALFFAKTSFDTFSRIYIGVLINLSFQVLYQIIYISYFIFGVFTSYFKEERNSRK